MDQEVIVPVVPGNAEHDVTDPPRGEDGYRQAIHLVQDAVQLFRHLVDTISLLSPEVSAKEAAEDERQGQTAAAQEREEDSEVGEQQPIREPLGEHRAYCTTFSPSRRRRSCPR